MGSITHIVSYLILTTFHQETLMPIFQMKITKYREGKQFSQVHTVSGGG